MNPVNTKPDQPLADAAWSTTGCSSGIGRVIAELVASKLGQRLLTRSRNPSSLSYLPDHNAILKLALDVASPASFHIDVLVDNAEYELAGDAEAAFEEEMHDQLETNFYGTSKNHRGGIIFNISSLADVAAFPGQAFYRTSRFTLEGWSESFARELVKTEFEHSSKKYTEVHKVYDGADMPARRLAARVKKGVAGAGGVQPSAVAEVPYLVTSRNGKIPSLAAFN
ncbi:NAD(P)-binding protein [Xylaria acuta]|nr:NAD(P)-binding protein [Xylaria acuta]